MKLVGKVPVEPLDDERLTNIERNLVVRVSELSAQRSAVRAPRRLLAVAAVAFAVVVAGVVGWKVRGDGTLPAIAPAPEQLAMTAGALDLGDAQISGRDFAVTRSAQRVEVVMQPGTIELHVEHKPERLFVVKAGNVEIEDVGTRFSVAYDGKNVDVRVTEGEVKVKHAGKEFPITASNAWTLELGPITIAQLTQGEAHDAQPTQVAAAAPATAGALAPAPGTGSAAPSPGGRAGSSAGATAGSASRTKPGTSNARQALDKVGIIAPEEVATDDPKAAIAIYLERVKTMAEGEDKAQVLYSIAVMQHRLKRDGDALYTISGVLRRQAGPAYKAARWLDVRIRCMKAFDDDCRMAAQKYLASFGDGVHAGVAQEILKEISRGQ